jgi:hypothetical protein
LLQHALEFADIPVGRAPAHLKISKFGESVSLEELESSKEASSRPRRSETETNGCSDLQTRSDQKKMDIHMTTAIARLFPRASATLVADLDTLVSTAIFCGTCLLLSLVVLILDQHIPGEWF